MTQVRDLPERSLRVLARVASLMASGQSCEITVVVSQGGVRGYKETHVPTIAQMEDMDHALLASLDRMLNC